MSSKQQFFGNHREALRKLLQKEKNNEISPITAGFIEKEANKQENSEYRVFQGIKKSVLQNHLSNMRKEVLNGKKFDVIGNSEVIITPSS